MNLPNKITLSRIALVPVFMIFILPMPHIPKQLGLFEFARPFFAKAALFLSQYRNYIAAAIFIIASSTDSVDGYIARKTMQITNFGKFLDPIADKLLVAAALIALVQRNSLTGWAAWIILSREFIVTGLRLVAANEGIVIAASKLGKIKTIIQTVAVSLMLLDNFPFSLFTTVRVDGYIMLIAVIITVYSGYDYIAKNMALIDYKV